MGLQSVTKRLEALEPESSPICPRCQRIAAMTEDELDAELARLLEIINESEEHEAT
jgi:hypothetical protein